MAKLKEKHIKQQFVTDNYSLYCGDSCKIIKGIKDESMGMVIFSPPFASLYSYSDDPADLSNCKDYNEFFTHFGFLVEDIERIMMPGRICALHCMDLPTHKNTGEEIGLKDFPGDIVKCFEKYGFVYHSRHCIWKDPLIAATRTKALGLAHKQIVKDSAMCRTGIPDYILAFRKRGENPKPIKHPRGLQIYHGSRDIPRLLDKYIENREDNPYDSRVDKRSHWIW